MIGTDRHLVLTVVTWMALAWMIVIVAIGEISLGSTYAGLTSVIPAFADERDALLVLGFAWGVCLEALLAVTGILVGFIAADRMFHPTALRLVDGLVVILGFATLLVFGTFFHMPAPVFAGLAIAGTAFGITVVLVVLVLRALLRRAASLHAELEEVV